MPRPRVYLWWLFERGEFFVPAIGETNIGQNSFPSGHTLTAFALFCFLTLVIRNKGWGLLLFSLAAVIAVSRVILCQHFVLDIYFGSIIGVFVAVTFYLILNKNQPKAGKWYDLKFVEWYKARKIKKTLPS